MTLPYEPGDTPATISFFPVLPPAGRWIISKGFQIYTAQRPNWFHRLFTRLLLDWKWEDL